MPRNARWLVLLALAVGLTRFFKLGEWSLWIDESLTWTDWHVGLEGGEIQNPLGYAFVAACVRLLGGVPDEFALRFGPALAGFLTIPLTWIAFRGVVGEFRAGAAALLVAASSWSVYWSQNARFYTAAQLVALCGAWLWYGALRDGSRPRALLALVVVASSALFHPSTALLVPALVLAPFLVRLARVEAPVAERRVARFALMTLVLGGLAALYWLFDAWRTYVLQKGLPTDLSAIAASLAHYAKTTGFFVTPLLAAGALAGAWFAWRRRDSAELGLAVTALLALGFALVAAVFARVTAQYVFFLLPWLAVLAVLPLARADENATPRARATGWAYLGLLFAPALVTVGLYLTVRRGERPAWREAYDLVADLRGPNDVVLGMDATVGEYYAAPHHVDLRHPREVGWLDYFHARDPRAWSRHARRAWFVVNPEEFLDWDPIDAQNFQRMLREECRLVRAFPLYVESRDLSVWVYVRG